MGNSRSRQRAQQQPAQPTAATEQAAPQPAPAPSYPPAPVYRPQVPYYPQPQPYANNGQYYGGWRPPHVPQYPPYPPQPRLPGSPFTQHAAAPAQELTQTATIRNAVNLKKNTLEATPVPGDPSKLALSFHFDASAPCCVTMFVMATEEPSKGCKLTPAKQQAAAPLYYEKGLGLKFPPAASEGAQQQQYVIDLGLYEEQQLVRHDKDTFPLVIRLETVTEKGVKDGHTLQELAPGGEQKVWVQSQTTFAVLHREEDGAWAVRVAKQKIWVDGVSYELQEIYGLEQTGAKAQEPTNLDDAEERLCVICLVNDRDTTVLPCRHMCMCHECAQELRKQTSKCPICRNHVESLLHIKMHKGSKASPQQQAAAAAQQQPAAPVTAAVQSSDNNV